MIFAMLQIRLHCQGDRSAWCPGHSFEQFEGARTAKSSLHHGGHRNRGRNLLPFHRSAWTDERISSAWIERAKRRAQVALFLVRVHRRNGQRLHLRSDAPFWRRFDGQVLVFEFLEKMTLILGRNRALNSSEPALTATLGVIRDWTKQKPSAKLPRLTELNVS